MMSLSRPRLLPPSGLARLLTVLAVALSVPACGPDASRYHRTSDLAAVLPLAQVQREAGTLDLGTPAARPHLAHGWSRDEAGPAGQTVIRTAGPEAELRFFLAEPRDLAVVLVCAPAGPPAEVRILVNGGEAGSFTPAAGFWEHAVTLPRAALVSGDNALVLRTAAGVGPRPGLICDEVRFQGLAAGEVRAVDGRLALPHGARLDYFLRWPEGPALLLDGLAVRGAPGRLRVSVRAAGGPEVEAALLEPDEDPAVLPLPELTPGEPVRLSLALVQDPTEEAAAAPGGASAVLTRPFLGSTSAGSSLPAGAAESSGAGKGALPAGAPPAPGRRLNVLVYLVDTLRADQLGCYGGRLPLSPALDAFAREATLFQHAVAQSPWTRPSVASIFTGLTPRSHGVEGRRDALAPEAITLAEVLQSQGFRTAAFVTNPNVARSFGVGQGFQTYESLPRRAHGSEHITRRAADWLAETGVAGAPPFFLYLHTVDPHGPYTPPGELRQRFAPGIPYEVGTRRWLKNLVLGRIPGDRRIAADLLRLYQAEVFANDRSFGALLDLLRERGLWEDTVVVFVSDHGEEFFEHGGWEHGRTLHTEMLDVPLVIRVPGLGEGRRVAALAQHADLLPTLLGRLGLPVPAGVEGRDLFALPEEPTGGPWDEPVYSDLDLDGFVGTAVTTPGWRLLDRRAPALGPALYARPADPREQRDLAPARPIAAGFLRTLLRARELAPGARLAPGTGEIDAEMRRQLQALGYLR